LRGNLYTGRFTAKAAPTPDPQHPVPTILRGHHQGQKRIEMILFGIKNCDSVKKARRWLDENNVTYQFHDFRKEGLDQATIEGWLTSVSWETLLNKRGTTWRQLEDSRKEHLNPQTAIALMLENPTLIKRPVIVRDDLTLVGFDEANYTSLL
jgi:arsenate reductase